MLVLPNPRLISSSDLTAGFTLLELVTVLFVIGLSAGVILPNLPTLMDRVSYAMNRETVIRNLNRLPYEAADNKMDYVLFGEIPFLSSQENVTTHVSSDDLPESVPFRSGRLIRANPALPERWRLLITKPIFYRSSGFCTGGSVLASIGNTEYELTAKAPLCQFKESGLQQ